MSTVPSIFQGNPTEDERIAAETLVIKKAVRGAVYDLRVGMPGIIRSFKATTGLCTVDITINDKMFINNQWVDVVIPTLQDVVLCLPGDTDWAITFPNIVGCECYVMVADMCVNAWVSSGKISNQEVDRRHDFSDVFAVLRPRSVPNAIVDYSTTQMQIRNADASTVISLDDTAIVLKATGIEIEGPVAAPTAPAYPTASMPIKINGVLYYLQLKSNP